MSTNPKFLRRMISYFGSKWRIASHYPRPEYDTVVEPFAGGAGYSLRYYSRKVVLCEKNEIVYSVWDYLIRSSYSDIMALPFLEEGQTVDDLRICQEAKWLIGFWVNVGSAYPRKSLVSSAKKWKHTTCGSAFWIDDRLRGRLATEVQYIKHWKVYNCEYYDCPVTGRATWFVDPPYKDQGSHYPNGSEGIDYEHLGDWCRKLSGQVIVCEAEGHDYWLPFEPFVTSGTTLDTKQSKYKEYVWISRQVKDEVD